MSLFECTPVHCSNDHAHPFGAPPVEGGRGSPETVGSVGSGSTARSAADPMQIHCRSAPVPLPRAGTSRAGRHDLTRPRNSRLTSTVKPDYSGSLNRNIIVISLEAADISDHGSSRLRRKEMYEFPDRHRP